MQISEGDRPLVIPLLATALNQYYYIDLLIFRYTSFISRASEIFFIVPLVELYFLCIGVVTSVAISAL